jgi:hypothetical protein
MGIFDDGYWQAVIEAARDPVEHQPVLANVRH